MAQRPNSPVVRFLNRLFENQKIAGLTDRQLLKRFASGRDEDAFTLLVRRHGGMVLGVCGRVLVDPVDVEDAFQATFLVLARKSSSFGWHDSIGNWLFGVALKVATKMRSQRHHRPLVLDPGLQARSSPAEQSDPGSHIQQSDLVAKLDEALRELPGKLRAPLVLCYLEGKSHQEAARALRIPQGSMSRHLARGLELLRERLARHNLLLSSDALAALLAQGIWRAIVDRSLAESTTRAAVLFKLGTMAATGAASVRTLTLAHGVLRTMFLTQLKVVAAATLLIGVLGAGGLLHEGHRGTSEGDGQAIGQPKEAVVQAGGQPKEAAVVADGQEEMAATRLLETLRKHHLMQSKMEKPVVLDKGLDKMTFGEAKNYLEDRFDITILANAKAFKAAGDDSNILEAHVALDKMSGVSLREVLKLLVDQFGGTFVVHRDYVEITAPEAVQPDLWQLGDRSLVPQVHADFKDVALDKALRELAVQTGISVVLDQGAFAEAGEPHVTALLDGTSLDTAAEILANMCNMKSVAMDRAIYVTTISKATELLEEQAQRRAAREKAEDKKRKEEEESKKEKTADKKAAGKENASKK